MLPYQSDCRMFHFLSFPWLWITHRKNTTDDTSDTIHETLACKRANKNTDIVCMVEEGKSQETLTIKERIFGKKFRSSSRGKRRLFVHIKCLVRRIHLRQSNQWGRGESPPIPQSLSLIDFGPTLRNWRKEKDKRTDRLTWGSCSLGQWPTGLNQMIKNNINEIKME